MALYKRNGYFLIHANDTVYLNNSTISPSVAFVAECQNDIWYTLEGNQIFCSIGIIQEIKTDNN